MNATFNQRMALSNMYAAMGKSTKGIRDMTVEEASRAIDAAKKEIDAKGFRRAVTDNDGLPDDCADW